MCIVANVFRVGAKPSYNTIQDKTKQDVQRSKPASITDQVYTTKSERLLLVASAGTAATSPLDLAILGADVRLDMALLGNAEEVLVHLTSMATPTKQYGVSAGGCTNGQLIEREALAAGLLNTGTRGGGEIHGADGHFGNVEEALIVEHLAHDDGRLLHALLHVDGDSGEGHRGARGARHKQALEDDAIEL